MRRADLVLAIDLILQKKFKNSEGTVYLKLLVR
jgi:hypothetical protein